MFCLLKNVGKFVLPNFGQLREQWGANTHALQVVELLPFAPRTFTADRNSQHGLRMVVGLGRCRPRPQRQSVGDSELLVAITAQTFAWKRARCITMLETRFEKC